MTEQEVPYSDCRLIAALEIAACVSLGYSTWLSAELGNDRSKYDAVTDKGGESLDAHDTSALDSVPILLKHAAGHLYAVLADNERRQQLAELLEGVVEEMEEWRNDRNRRGLLKIAWDASISEVKTGAEAIRRYKEQLPYCSCAQSQAPAPEEETATEPELGNSSEGADQGDKRS